MNTILIIGAGAIGLSVGYELSKRKNLNIYIVEKNKNVGLENSSKNSEVIHSGVYYKKNTLKNKLCVEGKKLIYKFCKKNNIKYKKTGKIFIAQSKSEENYLKLLKFNSIKNNVRDIKILSKEEINKIEPNLNCTKGLISPSSGIFDSKKFMLTLLRLCKKQKVKFILNKKIIKLNKLNNKFQMKDKKILFDYVINCSGMNSISIAKNMFSDVVFPENNFVKGVYFKTSQKLNLNRIIYRAMVPGTVKERIDTTPTIKGHYIFGPNVETSKTLNINKIKKYFYTEVKKYLPDIEYKKLKYFKTGYRPKIYYYNIKTNEDYYIKKMKQSNWINLFGIESPGLTSCLSIGKYVKKLIK